MTDTEQHRDALIARLVKFNPFAGLDYYKSLTTKQLEETAARLAQFGKKGGN